MKLPQVFIDKMNDLLGEEAPKFFDALELPSQKAITLNTNRINEEKFKTLCDFDIEKIEGISNGYYVNNLKFSKNILSHMGCIYSQEPSAMYPVEMLDVKENDIVLDVCAAPGGKSIQILEKLNGTGFLLSNEIVYNRCKILYENLNRMAFKNFAISCSDPNELSKLNCMFDKIIVDAPCGGEGMFRKNSFDENAYHPESIDSNADRQLEILENTKELLRKGGRLVYSTCTYDIKENEGVVCKFLDNNKNFRLIEINGYENVTSRGIKISNHPTQYCMRRYPHLHLGEGQFMAIFEKIDNEEIEKTNFCSDNFTKLSNKDIKLLSDILKNVCDINIRDIVKKNNDYFIATNHNLDLRKINLVCIGCLIGSNNGKTFKLNHNFYHTYGDKFFNKINLTKEETLKYLHGEEIDVNANNGIYSVMHEDIPIGGGKVTNNKLKNHYPKELRI